MCLECDRKIEDVWRHIAAGQAFQTPDALVGVPFRIANVMEGGIDIEPQGIHIARAAFASALHYLISNGHTENRPCAIDSNNNPDLSGPLCVAAREQNNNIRCINYIVPMLAQFGILAFDSARPNTTWAIGRGP